MKPYISASADDGPGGEAFPVEAANSDNPTDLGSSKQKLEQTIVLIVDLTPAVWVNGVPPLSKSQNVSRLQLYNLYNIMYRFIKTYAIMSSSSRCCIIATHSSESRILYEGLVSNDWLTSSFHGVSTQNEHADATMTGIWRSMLDFIASGADSPSGDPQLTTALSMGLLYLNRLNKTGTGYGRRILLFDVSTPDGYKSQYIGLMNVAFTASKSHVSINTCAFGQSSRILEQLSDITNAKYLSLPKILKSEEDLQNYDQSISQLLAFWFLPSHSASEHLSTQLPFDFSNTAVCYCHYSTVDIAFICPCCFAVYCSETEDNGKYRIFCFICKYVSTLTTIMDTAHVLPSNS